MARASALVYATRSLIAFAVAFSLWSGSPLAQQAVKVYEIAVDGLACPFCAYGVEKQLSALAGVREVETDIGRGVVRVVMAEGATLDEATARRAVEASGFPFRGLARVGSERAGGGGS